MCGNGGHQPPGAVWREIDTHPHTHTHPHTPTSVSAYLNSFPPAKTSELLDLHHLEEFPASKHARSGMHICLVVSLLVKSKRVKRYMLLPSFDLGTFCV